MRSHVVPRVVAGLAGLALALCLPVAASAASDATPAKAATAAAASATSTVQAASQTATVTPMARWVRDGFYESVVLCEIAGSWEVFWGDAHAYDCEPSPGHGAVLYLLID